MAYKKNYKGKKSSGWQDAKTVGKLAWKHKGTAVKALKLASKVARMVNVEYKVIENNYNQTVDSSGIIDPMTVIPIGDNELSREGISVKAIRVSGRCYVTMHPSASTTLFRMVIFKGKFERANPYSVNNNTGYAIFDDDTIVPLARKNQDNRFGTKILYDRLFTLNSSGNQSKVFDVNVRLNHHVNFTSEQPNGSDIDDGGVYLLIVSDQGTNTPTFKAQLAFTYVDN